MQFGKVSLQELKGSLINRKASALCLPAPHQLNKLNHHCQLEKTKLHTCEGRLVLTKTMLSAIPVYMTMVIKLPLE